MYTLTQPIGIFDSGIGGLSVWRELIKRLPRESTLYFGDSKNCPYGGRSISEIRELTAHILQFLMQWQCKLIIVACNTISVTLIDELRQNYDVPLVAVEPATKVAAARTKTGNIGVLATAGTFKGPLFLKTIKRYGQNINVYYQTGIGLVEKVEAGDIDGPEVRKLLQAYVRYFLEKDVDQIVLGCTHYPFLKKLILELSAGRAEIIDPAQAVVEQTKRRLQELHLLAPADGKPEYRFFTSGRNFPLALLLPGVELNKVQLTEGYDLRQLSAL